MYNIAIQYFYHTSKVALTVKNLPANAGDTRDAGNYQKMTESPCPMQCILVAYFFYT